MMYLAKGHNILTPPVSDLQDFAMKYNVLITRPTYSRFY